MCPFSSLSVLIRLFLNTFSNDKRKKRKITQTQKTPLDVFFFLPCGFHDQTTFNRFPPTLSIGKLFFFFKNGYPGAILSSFCVPHFFFFKCYYYHFLFYMNVEVTRRGKKILETLNRLFVFFCFFLSNRQCGFLYFLGFPYVGFSAK